MQHSVYTMTLCQLLRRAQEDNSLHWGSIDHYASKCLVLIWVQKVVICWLVFVVVIFLCFLNIAWDTMLNRPTELLPLNNNTTDKNATTNRTAATWKKQVHQTSWSYHNSLKQNQMRSTDKCGQNKYDLPNRTNMVISWKTHEMRKRSEQHDDDDGDDVFVAIALAFFDRCKSLLSKVCKLGGLRP